MIRDAGTVDAGAADAGDGGAGAQDVRGRVDELAQLSWPQVPVAPLLVVPVGSCEQHGPHLPLGTDTTVATVVAGSLVALLRASGQPVLAAPAVAYGASGEHEGFPGTLSIGQDAVRLLLLELGRSARRWCSRLLLVNGHGGNAVPVAQAVQRLRYEGDDAGWLPCATRGGDAHAGRVETSLALALTPRSVRIERAEAGATRPVRELLDQLRQGGVATVSPNGVLGDPAGASAAEGRRLLAELVKEALDAVRRWTPTPDGRLRSGPAGAAAAPAGGAA